MNTATKLQPSAKEALTHLASVHTQVSLKESSPWTPAQEGWDRLEKFVSPLVGIVQRTFAQLRDFDEAAVAAVGARAADARFTLGSSCNELNGGGHPTPEQARAAAIGETVERYSVAFRDPSRLIRTSSEVLEALHVPHTTPEELTLFAPHQYDAPGFPYIRFQGGTDMEWVAGTDLIHGGPRLVPADLVYMDVTQIRSAPIGYPTSNGLACDCTADEATAGGVLELIERDAFTTTWYNQLSLPRIDERSDPVLARFIDTHIGGTGLDLALIDLSVFSQVPTVLAVIRNPHNGVAPLALGAASATTVRSACRKALIEGFQTRGWSKAEQRDGAMLSPDKGFGQVRTFDDHVRMSLHPDSVAAASFLDASKERVAVSEIPEVPDETPGQVITHISALMAEQDVDLTAVDVTSPDVHEGGLSVIKVFSAALSPLDAGYHQRFLGNRRLRTRPFELGLLSAPADFVDLNPWPHPFP